MIRPALFVAFATCMLSLFGNKAFSQDDLVKKEKKPYSIQTIGNQVTIRSSKNIKNIMVWTASGNRLVEQHDLNSILYKFSINRTAEKVFFVMIQYAGQKPYTEKIGVQ